jgi:integrase
VKQSTLREYSSIVAAHLVPAFGERPVEALTTREIELWRSRLIEERKLSRRTINRVLTALGGVMGRAQRLWDLPSNPVMAVERRPDRYSGELQVLSPEEVLALSRAAESPQDAAIFLLAGFTGLRRGEIVALTWRDVDCGAEAIRVRASVTHGFLSPPKSGKVRVVPLVPVVAEALSQLGLREHFTGDEDLVFPSPTGTHLDGSALRRRYKRALARAGLREIRFHDLRHSFATMALGALTLVEVKEALGHSDLRTTQRYLHYKPKRDEARRLAGALAFREPDSPQLPAA